MRSPRIIHFKEHISYHMSIHFKDLCEASRCGHGTVGPATSRNETEGDSAPPQILAVASGQLNGSMVTWGSPIFRNIDWVCWSSKEVTNSRNLRFLVFYMTPKVLRPYFVSPCRKWHKKGSSPRNHSNAEVLRPRVYSNVVGFHGRGFIAMSWVLRPRVYSNVR